LRDSVCRHQGFGPFGRLFRRRIFGLVLTPIYIRTVRAGISALSAPPVPAQERARLDGPGDLRPPTRTDAQRRFGRSGLSGCDRTADSHPGDQAHTTRPRPTVHHCAGRAKMPSHPKNILITRPNTNITAAPERWPSGRRRSPAKGVYVKSVSRVRIPSSPPLFFKSLVFLKNANSVGA
jgi:hypothetical protein